MFVIGKSIVQVPLACDLGQVLPQLAYLRSFEGVVDLALKKAAALDPEELASRPDGDSAREVCMPHPPYMLPPQMRACISLSCPFHSLQRGEPCSAEK